MPDHTAPERIFNVLFLCTGNSARSILAESILNKDGAGRFRAYSAGRQPKGEVNPLAITTLANFDYPTEGLRSKAWDEFAGPDAPVMDFVFTVCDNAAGEACPVWPGQPMTAHWGIEDPAAVEGPEIARQTAFVSAFRYLRNRIGAFAALPVSSLDKSTLRTRLVEIGQSEGASSPRGSAAEMSVVIYHNPDCGTSRNTLALIRHHGFAPEVVEYLKTPPTRSELADLIGRAGLTVRAVLRKKGTPYAELGLDDPGLSDGDLLDAMMAHPILINRPLVVTPKGVALCRPSDVAADLLPDKPVANLLKEEGAPFLKDRLAADDAGLAAALAVEGLPVDDLTDAGRTFYTFSTLDGATVGYGGLELLGEHVLLRSVAVLPAFRGKGLGCNIVPLLLYRAYRAGARTAWLLTDTAAPFFGKIGFRVVDRQAAPAAILATRQAASLCPTSAPLLSRSIGF